LEQEKIETTPKPTDVIDLTKEEEEVVKIGVPIRNESLPATENPTWGLIEDRAKQENKEDIAFDTHDPKEDTT